MRNIAYLLPSYKKRQSNGVQAPLQRIALSRCSYTGRPSAYLRNGLATAATLARTADNFKCEQGSLVAGVLVAKLQA